jgi:hypothetical protein
MPLEVHYVNDKSWDAEAKKFSDPKIRQEADDIGHFLMRRACGRDPPEDIKKD